MAGCGPTTTSNLFWYLTKSRPEVCGNLYTIVNNDRTEMLELMEQVWEYVKPGMKGVNKSSMLTEGAIQYGRDKNVALDVRVLEVPEEISNRPSENEVLKFLSIAFSEDLPVAFLNLSNGAVENLDNWHWVTLISTNMKLQAEMYDQSMLQIIDVKKWLTTTTKCGSFVVVVPMIQ